MRCLAVVKFRCEACGFHPQNYIHCDRWDCPLLVAREAIEGDDHYIAVGAPPWPMEEFAARVLDWRGLMPEDERDPEPPDEDDDEVAVDWDENSQWPSENDETEEDDE